ncbi:MAG TPA: hypothetical protein VNH11_03260 [Pirellulales bacterium]|nr:hypothetical protein [Pirellulales bacterium]
MFKGAVNFRAAIEGNGLTFPSFEFNPNEAAVEKVAIEAPASGDTIVSTVYLDGVATEADRIALATKVNTAALNRIAFARQVSIDHARETGHALTPVQQQPGVVVAAGVVTLYLSGEAKVVLGIDHNQLRAQLEQASPPGERNYALFRSARLSVGAVEEFMHLYNILMMLYNDKQAQVDAFIIQEEPAVQQTQSGRPRAQPGEMETVYTRLRNELAHKRQGVNLDHTKMEMAQFVGNLRALARRAIELHP